MVHYGNVLAALKNRVKCHLAVGSSTHAIVEESNGVSVSFARDVCKERFKVNLLAPAIRALETASVRRAPRSHLSMALVEEEDEAVAIVRVP